MTTQTKTLKQWEIEQLIVAEHYYPTPGSSWVTCTLDLKGGYTVAGCAGSSHPDGNNSERARTAARHQAILHIMMHEGYLTNTYSAAPCTTKVMDVMTESMKVHLQGFLDRGDKQGLRAALDDSRNAISG
ncbi:hypothetical protein [Enterobacter ludwigii]